MLASDAEDCEEKWVDGYLFFCESTTIDRYWVDMWESVNVYFYLTVFGGVVRKKKISKEVLQQLILLVGYRLPHEIRI